MVKNGLPVLKNGKNEENNYSATYISKKTEEKNDL
jgi:hypothetical protein